MPPHQSLRAAWDISEPHGGCEEAGDKPIGPRRWLHELLGQLRRWLEQQGGGVPKDRRFPLAGRDESPPTPPTGYQPLERVAVTTGVLQTLFDEYELHRRSDRGHEETGWVLLGWREEREAVVRATIPAGAGREAGEAHIRFSSTVQAAATRFVRQHDRRLTMLGVVHTHPGSLRHPSDGDYRGDIEWVGQLRGREGVFGIGTADRKQSEGDTEITQPRSNMLTRGSLCFSWYSLCEGDRNYRRVPLTVVDGPDLAAPLRPAWEVLEDHASRIERLAFQQARLRFDILPRGLALTVPLVEGPALQALMTKEGVRYLLTHGGEAWSAECREPRVDCGVYQLLANWASEENT
ncbi:MAG: Mov34/MPN/PAD-1 family protein [Gemmataceae bacterium]|nr:Mov34/MPN/PAD-1 family protein [Gemmataceae bacterium]